jgi:hypothetical protein
VVYVRQADVEGADHEMAGGERLELEPLRQALVAVHAVDEADPLGGAGRAVHRDGRLRAGRGVGPGHRVRVQVHAVVRVQVAEADGVHVEQARVLLQRAERSVTHVNH